MTQLTYVAMPLLSSTLINSVNNPGNYFDLFAAVGFLIVLITL